jgi:hypothetical protein
MAEVVTPESAPVGFQNMNAALIGGDLSAVMSNAANANDPMPAASSAAAPGPFVGTEEIAESACVFIVPPADRSEW